MLPECWTPDCVGTKQHACRPCFCSPPTDAVWRRRTVKTGAGYFLTDPLTIPSHCVLLPQAMP